MSDRSGGRDYRNQVESYVAWFARQCREEAAIAEIMRMRARQEIGLSPWLKGSVGASMLRELVESRRFA
jgi:hypothetical protein